MNLRPLFLAIMVITLMLAAGGVCLATRDISAHRQTIEKVIGNDRFFK